MFYCFITNLHKPAHNTIHFTEHLNLIYGNVEIHKLIWINSSLRG